MNSASSSYHFQRVTSCSVGVAALLNVTINVPSALISNAKTPYGCGLKMVFLGVPELTSQTTSIESSPVSAVTMISRFLL